VVYDDAPAGRRLPLEELEQMTYSWCYAHGRRDNHGLRKIQNALKMVHNKTKKMD
jgi:hypothetical protein